MMRLRIAQRILPNGVENQFYVLSKKQLLEGFYDVDDMKFL